MYKNGSGILVKSIVAKFRYTKAEQAKLFVPLFCGGFSGND